MTLTPKARCASRLLLALSATAFLCVVLAGSLRAEEGAAAPKLDLGATLPIDPALERMSGLPNGMAYWIYRHPMPAGKVTLMLHIGSGSLNEEESQRGLAHFLEHMAFNGSEHFPPGEVVKYFESMGMRFGQHQNAFTAFDQTTYMLSLPDTKQETLARGLLFFADVAHALSILPSEVDKERGVITEEQRARTGVNMRMMEKQLPVLLPGSRVSQRIPIGLTEVIQNAPPERLRAYYEKWYRPDISALIVVGDIDPKAIEPLIKQTFSSWKKPESEVAQVASGMKPFQGLKAAVFSDPEQTNVEASMSYLRPAHPLQTNADLRAELVERLARHIMNRRLRTISQENKAAYLRGQVQGGQTLTDHEFYGLEAQATAEGWRSAFAQVVHELHRALAHGFGEKELARARAALLAQYGQVTQAMSSLPAMLVGRSLLDDLVNGHRPISPKQQTALAEVLLPGITAEEVANSLRAMYDLENTYLTLAFPEKDGVAVPSEGELLAVFAIALQREAEAQEERADVGRLLEKDPEPAEVTALVHDADLDATSLTFANGARVHIKPINTVETVQISIRVFGGVAEETAATKGFTEAAAVAWSPTRMATRTLKPVDIGQYLSQRQASVAGGQDDVSLHLSVSGPASAVEDGLRLSHLLLTEPRVDTTALAAWKQQRAMMFKQFKSSAAWQAVVALRADASGDDLRFAMGTLPQYQAITVPQAQGWLDRIVRTGPIEVAISGGITLEDAQRLARTWIGSLPARPDRSHELETLREVKLAIGPMETSVPLETITPQAFVLLGWRGVDPDDARGQIALTQAASILSTRLINSVREERGLTYSIGCGYQFTNFKNLDGLLVQFTADPAKAVEAALVARDTILTFAKDGPTEDEILATEKQMENVLGEQAKSPDFWISILGTLHANGRTLAEIKARLEAIKVVDKTCLMKTLKEVLQDERFSRVIASPAGAPDPK